PADTVGERPERPDDGDVNRRENPARATRGRAPRCRFSSRGARRSPRPARVVPRAQPCVGGAAGSRRCLIVGWRALALALLPRRDTLLGQPAFHRRAARPGRDPRFPLAGSPRQLVAHALEREPAIAALRTALGGDAGDAGGTVTDPDRRLGLVLLLASRPRGLERRDVAIARQALEPIVLRGGRVRESGAGHAAQPSAPGRVAGRLRNP